MKIYLSINHKFFEYSPKQLIEIIEKYDVNNSVKGFEIFLNIQNSDNYNYFNELIRLAIAKGYDIQFHGDSSLNYEEMTKYLDTINEFSKIYNRKFNVVLHPISNNLIEEDIISTNIYFSKVLNYIYYNNYNLNISIENLNSMTNLPRCNKEQLMPIINNNRELLFTYDIGHEIIDYGKITNLEEVFINRLCNVHLHTFNNREDHQKLDENDIYKERWIKGILYLKSIDYNGPVVLEFDFYTLGDNFENRMIEYINIANYISEHF